MLRGMGGTKLTWTISQGRHQGRMCIPEKIVVRILIWPVFHSQDQDSKSGGQLPRVTGHECVRSPSRDESVTPRLPAVQDASGCDSQLVSHSDEDISPKLFQKVCPRTAVSSETIHEKCLIGGLRGGLRTDNDLLKKKFYFGSLEQIVHRSSNLIFLWLLEISHGRSSYCVVCF